MFDGNRDMDLPLEEIERLLAIEMERNKTLTEWELPEDEED